MPTYQYACTACGHQLEAVQSFSDEPLTECPACEGRLRKVFNSVGVVFKGSGFYRTDSRASGTEGKSSAVKSDSTSSGSGKDSSGSSPATGSGSSTGSGSTGSGASAGSGSTGSTSGGSSGSTKSPAASASS
ncbi:FmdB family transcriptional regulator [Micromonospora rifamycinica]|uniref:FmdB family zinc ribbon protein n=1 Tax=Micromonospora rifamycinica TaxID=291594 RepID=UPI002E29E68B|nr:FmdB family zinc ribbon protein [Micromonospora rifamycinica]